jgi:hypothetical protein
VSLEGGGGGGGLLLVLNADARVVSAAPPLPSRAMSFRL